MGTAVTLRAFSDSKKLLTVFPGFFGFDLLNTAVHFVLKFLEQINDLAQRNFSISVFLELQRFGVQHLNILLGFNSIISKCIPSLQTPRFI